MKVGDYIRTKKGLIGKIYNINEFREPSMMYAIDIPRADTFIFMGENDFKSSPNIIDLIEENDYINGSRVIFIDKKDKHITVSCRVSEDGMICEKDIKTILTKEQFESMKYKVGDKE